MSRSLAALVYSRQCGSMARKAVLAYFAERASNAGLGIWASKQRIATDIECSRQTVITTVKSLIADGLITETGKRKTQGGFTVVYCLNVKAIEALLEPANQSSHLTPSEDKPVKEFDGLESEVVKELDANQSSHLTQTVHEPKLEEETNVSSAREDFQTILDLWKLTAKPFGLSCWEKETPKRRKAVAARLKDYGMEDFRRAIEHVPRCKFLRGETGTWGGATMDFLCQPDAIAKILEGKYDDRSNKPAQTGQRNGIAAALDRKLGLDESARPSERRAIGSGGSHSDETPTRIAHMR